MSEMRTIHSYNLTPLVYILFDAYHSQHIAHRHQNQQGESWPQTCILHVDETSHPCQLIHKSNHCHQRPATKLFQYSGPAINKVNTDRTINVILQGAMSTNQRGHKFKILQSHLLVIVSVKLYDGVDRFSHNLILL